MQKFIILLGIAVHVHIAVPAAAGLAAGFVFVALFSIWAANPPIYRVDSWTVSKVTIPEGASIPGGRFEPQTASVKDGDSVEWTNHEVVPTTLVIQYACKPLQDGAKIMPFGVEKYLAPGESFECRFMDTGEYIVHTMPWQWMQGTVKVAP